MQQLNQIIEALNQDVLNGTGEKTSQMLMEGVLIVLVSSAVLLEIIGILSSTMLLLESYLTGHIIYQKSIFSFLSISHGVSQFQYHCLRIAGCSWLGLTAFCPSLLRLNRLNLNPNYKYVSFTLGYVFFISSIWLGISLNFITINSWDYWGEVLVFIGLSGNLLLWITEPRRYLHNFFSLITLIGLLIWTIWTD